MTFKIIETYSTGDYTENNTWECTKCGFSVSYDANGDAPCECPQCLADEARDEAGENDGP